MNAEQFAKEKFPGLNLNEKELKTLWLGYTVVEKELANKDVEKVPPPDPAELFFSAKRNLTILAYQQKFTIDDDSWEKILSSTLTNQNAQPLMVRNDAVYKVTTSKGSGIFVISYKPPLHYFSFYQDKGYPAEAYHLMCLGEVKIDKQTPGKVEADLERVRKTEEEFSDPVEAKDWISKNREGSFASHVFSKKKEALEFVNKLYEFEVPKVTIWNISKMGENDPQGLEFYADELIVKLPNERSKREAIFSFLNNYKEDLCEHYKEERQKTISLFWDY